MLIILQALSKKKLALISEDDKISIKAVINIELAKNIYKAKKKK